MSRVLASLDDLTPEWLTETLHREGYLSAGSVESVFYCTGVFHFYTHKSEETELRTGADKGVDDWAANLEEATGRVHARGGRFGRVARSDQRSFSPSKRCRRRGRSA